MLEDGPFRATEAENAYMSSGLPERRIPVITLMPRVPSSAQSHSIYVLRSTQAIIRSLSVSKLKIFYSFETERAIRARARRGG